MPVRVSTIYFSDYRKALAVFIAVENLAFEKSVTCRFTRDYWKTVSETPAQYYGTAGNRGGKSYDKFVVSIAFAKDDELGDSPFFFCVKYAVNEEEYWDNNSGINFEVDFHNCK
ncbi:putative phosphatase regulatory subunit [Fusarium venenatum]|nr:putative phosphatase regulatory subunit [Fusarium venenatum]